MESLYHPHRWQELRQILAQRQKAGESIVFTNGCFDLLHPGHVDILKRSRREGDCLVVGLNSDESVNRLKGPSRPVQNINERAAALLAMEEIFAVAVFNEETPREIVNALKPDYITKGGDYRPDTVVGADVVKKVIIFPLLEGHSTTEKIRKMKQKK